MDNISILEYEISCSLGNKYESVQKIKNLQTGLSKRDFHIANRDFSIPFFPLKNEVLQKQDAIYNALKRSVISVISTLDAHQRASCALIIGTSQIDWYLVDAINSSAYDEQVAYSSSKRSIDSYAKDISKELGLSDFTLTINTACTSSANAIIDGVNLIKSGIFKYVAVVGAEIFSPIMSSGFDSMELLSKTFPKPFDKNRDGLVLGEGIASILLGMGKSNWSILGGFSNTNSETITSVSQGGEECVDVMQQALKNANIKECDITLLKAHATGSQSNDLSEINAISKIFEPSIQICALKPYIGHTIGACGVLEISLLMGCIDNGFIPQTLFCEEPIKNNFKPIKEHIEEKEGIFMCNYFGFGGNNISIIIKKELA